MDQESPKAKALSELRELGLTSDITEEAAARIKADLLVIDGLRLQGGYRRENGFFSDRHLYAAYQVIAQEIVDENTPDEILDTPFNLAVNEAKEEPQDKPYDALSSGRFAIVIIEHATQPPSPLNCAGSFHRPVDRSD